MCVVACGPGAVVLAWRRDLSAELSVEWRLRCCFVNPTSLSPPLFLHRSWQHEKAAANAVEAMNNFELAGRRLKVGAANSGSSAGGGGGGGGAGLVGGIGGGIGGIGMGMGMGALRASCATCVYASCLCPPPWPLALARGLAV